MREKFGYKESFMIIIITKYVVWEMREREIYEILWLSAFCCYFIHSQEHPKLLLVSPSSPIVSFSLVFTLNSSSFGRGLLKWQENSIADAAEIWQTLSGRLGVRKEFRRIWQQGVIMLGKFEFIWRTWMRRECDNLHRGILRDWSGGLEVRRRRRAGKRENGPFSRGKMLIEAVSGGDHRGQRKVSGKLDVGPAFEREEDTCEFDWASIKFHYFSISILLSEREKLFIIS